jgi:hypothetical protein
LALCDSPISLIEDKTGRLSFDTTDVIKAESQAMLNTLTEHDFQFPISLIEDKTGRL